MNKQIAFLSICLLISCLFYSCTWDLYRFEENEWQCGGLLIDIRDDEVHVYKTTAIGTKCWMAENLRDYRSGMRINSDTLGFDTGDVNCEESYYYHNKGHFYFWSDVTNPNIKLCPEGWHISSDEEWKELEAVAGIPEEELDSLASPTDCQPIRGFNKEVIPNLTEILGFEIKDYPGYAAPNPNVSEAFYRTQCQFLIFLSDTPATVENDGINFRKFIQEVDGIVRGKGSKVNMDLNLDNYCIRCVKDQE